MRQAILVLVALLLCPSGAAAEEAIADSHRAAAAELLEAIDVEATLVGAATAMTEAMIQQNTMLKPYRDVVIRWAESFMTWEVFGPKMIEIYAETFTESELRELTAFYKTPTGRKTITLMPQLMQRGAMLGAEIAAEHSAELEEMIEARTEELSRAPDEPAPEPE